MGNMSLGNHIISCDITMMWSLVMLVTNMRKLIHYFNTNYYKYYKYFNEIL